MPSSSATGKSHPLTREQYRLLIEAFREQPGAFAHAARRAGVDPRTAKRYWDGEPSPVTPWAVPIQGVLEEEKRAAQAAKLAAEAEARRAAEAELADRKAKEDEALQVEDQALRVLRGAVVRSAAAALQVSQGMGELAKRVNDQLVRGTDANGNALPIDAMEFFQMMQKQAQSTSQLTQALQRLVEVTNLRNGLPTEVLAHQMQAPVTLEQANEVHALAGEALQRAQHLQLVVDNAKGAEAAANPRPPLPEPEVPDGQGTQPQGVPPAPAEPDPAAEGEPPLDEEPLDDLEDGDAAPPDDEGLEPEDGA